MVSSQMDLEYRTGVPSETHFPCPPPPKQSAPQWTVLPSACRADLDLVDRPTHFETPHTLQLLSTKNFIELLFFSVTTTSHQRILPTTTTDRSNHG